VKCHPQQILVFSGSQQALYVATQLLLQSGDSVWMEDPGYLGAIAILKSMGARIVPVPVDEQGMVVSEAIHRSAAAKLAFVTPSHQFPLGYTMSVSRRLELLQWASESKAWIIEDDYDSEFRYSSRPLPSLQSMDPENRVIYIGTLSKVMFPTMRLAYMVAPVELVHRLLHVRQVLDLFPPTLFCAAMAEFIRDGHFGRHIRRMRSLYAERRKALIECLEAEMSDTLQCVNTDAGLHLTAWLSGKGDDVIASANAARHGIFTRPLSSHYLTPAKRNGLILGFGCVPSRSMRQSVSRLKEALEGHGNR
jgi:GntR family transcriptional regulator / MocR family aminotransferase